AARGDDGAVGGADAVGEGERVVAVGQVGVRRVGAGQCSGAARADEAGGGGDRAFHGLADQRAVGQQPGGRRGEPVPGAAGVAVVHGAGRDEERVVAVGEECAAGAEGDGDGGGLPAPYERGGAVGGGGQVPAAGAGVGGEGQGLLLGGGDEPGTGHRRAAARVGVPDERRAGGQHVAQGVGGAPAVVGDQNGGRAEDRLAGLVGGGAGPAVAAVQAGHGPVPGQHAGLLRQRPGERQGDDLDPGPQEPFQFAAGRVAAQRGDEGDLAAVAGGEVGG